MILLKVFEILLICGLLYGQDNILPGSTIFVSENKESARNLNDGYTDDYPMVFSDPNVQWAVFDLGDAFQLSKIVMWNGDHQSKDPISFYIGNEFIPCKFHLQIKKYNLCQKNVIQNDVRIEINCEGSDVTGRYLAMVKGMSARNQHLESLYVNELEAFGILVPGQTFSSRPVINNEDLPVLPDNVFDISKAILNNVDHVTVPRYSNALLYLNKNCQSIIWDPNSSNVFSVACQTSDGKGRLTVFGKESYLSNLLKDQSMVTLKKNILTFLSPNTANPNVISTKSINSLADLKTKVKTGDILDFYTWITYPNDVLDEIIRMCLSGTISISLDHTFWVPTSNEITNAFMKILNQFNVEASQTFFTWDSTQDFIYTNDNFIENILDCQYILERMAINNEYFLKNGNAIIQTFSQMSSTLIVNSEVGNILKKFIEKYDPLLKWICPCKVGPAIDFTDRAIINIYSQLMLSQSLANSNYKLPCVDLFPGDFETSPEKKSVTLTIQSQTEDTNHPVGYYLEAGTTLKYTIQKSVGKWAISVGCHSDILDDNRPEWYRYPNIYINKVNLNEIGEIFSPFGGVIWLSNVKAADSITIVLSNVVATPFFNGRDKSASSNWADQVKNVGIWSQLLSDTIVICEKSSSVINYDGDYIESLMTNNWDPMIKMDYAISGIDWKIQRPQIVVLDIMTSFGYGHSGYPIVVWDDWNPVIFNKTLIEIEGSWGMCHEIGHNLQDNRLTYIGLTEVTNNALCLFNYDKLWHIPRYGNNAHLLNNAQNKIINYLNNGANFVDYSTNPWIELAIYSQMADNFGWGFFKSVFKYYHDHNLNPSEDEEKIDTWITSTSIVSGQNLLPLFEFWGIPISDKVISVVSKLPCFFPDDFLIKFSSDRRDFFQSKYTDCNAKSSYFQDYEPKDDITGNLPNFIMFS